MKIDSMLTEIDSYTTNANKTKELVLDRLLKDGVINQEQYDNYNANWQVIIIKDSWFNSWIKKFYKEALNDYMFKYVKFE